MTRTGATNHCKGWSAVSVEPTNRDMTPHVSKGALEIRLPCHTTGGTPARGAMAVTDGKRTLR